MDPEDQQFPISFQPQVTDSPASDRLGYILVLAGSIIFMAIAGGMFGFNLQLYLNQNLRQLNPQSISGIWMYGPELFIGLTVLILSLSGMKGFQLHSAKIRWATVCLVTLAFGYFIYLLGWYFLGLFVDMSPLGIGLVLMVIGSVKNLF